MRWRTAGIIVLVVLSVVVAAAKWPRRAKARAPLAPLPTAAVQVESFDVTLRVPGVLDAARSEPVLMEAPQGTISWIAEEGTSVKPGDVLVRLNATELTKQLTEQEKQHAQALQQERTAAEDAQRRVQTSKVALEKVKSDIILTRSQGQASVERAQAQLDFAEQEMQLARVEHGRSKRLADEHLLPLAQLEESSATLRRQQFALETAQKELVKATHEAQVNEQVKVLEQRKAELEVQSAEAAQRQSALDTARTREERNVRLTELRTQVGNTEVKATAAGMLLLGESYGPFDSHRSRVGDQIGEGNRIASIIDPGNMNVLCDVGEADIARVRIGQVGLVRVEAIGEAPLHGKVVAIDNISRDRPFWEGGTAKRIFNVKLQLTDHDTRLRPGMSGTVEIVLERAEQELSVPAEAVFMAAGQEVVYRRRGDQFEVVPVKVLRRSEMRASLKSALRAGEVIARRQPPAARVVGAKERKP